jgi:inorganic triphosphatase YgiF
MDAIDQAAPELCKLANLPVPAVLIRVCGAKFTRLAATLTVEDTAVELALDKGFLLGGNKEQPLLEVEVEYKSGDEQKAEQFAYALAQTFNLKSERKSKFRRAMDLAQE